LIPFAINRSAIVFPSSSAPARLPGRAGPDSCGYSAGSVLAADTIVVPLASSITWA
jgi:hypothetical protein